MLPSNEAMRTRALFVAALPVLLAALAFVACSDKSSTVANAGKIASQTPSAAASNETPTPSPTPDPDALGPAPALGGNITAITPAHGAQVKQASTRSPDPNNPHGLCVTVNFDGLPENFQWFRVAYDADEVTQKLVLIATTTVNPKDGRICYAPVEGFTPGVHSAAVVVQDPRNPQASTRQTVAWKFTVIP